MECSVKGLSMLMLLSLWLTASYTYVIPSPMDPIEQCIFTCDHCYQSMKLLQCANECVMTDGAMNRHWHKTCPELLLPLFVEVDIDKTPKVMQTK